MSLKPILFNTDMVRAVLEDRKTVTRRVVKLKYSNTHLGMFTNKYGTRLVEKQNEEPGITTIRNPDGTTTHKLLACIEKTPPYHPGDILYVRETWAKYQGVYIYRTNCQNTDSLLSSPWAEINWRPSIHMPREAARIFLRVTDVRVERLQDITAEQVLDEGVEVKFPEPKPGYVSLAYTEMRLKPAARKQFSALRDSTIKPADRARYGWAANPWVWVIEFERIGREEAHHAET